MAPPAPFDQAVTAIITGDAPTLRHLLQTHPDLIHARSPGPHHSTLLHYVSANGVENELQKTPANILEIANILLHAGADVNAESDAYAGHSTTLNLTATSCHPERAGVQFRLLELLLARGAALEVPETGSIVNACLHNGRGPAAAFLAQHGARLDLEGAAGTGRLDLVRQLYPNSTPRQRADAMNWACQFGRADAAAWLLDQKDLPEHLGLHWAAHNGHVEIVRLLLARNPDLQQRDARFQGTAIDWALHGWQDRPETFPPDPWYEIATLLTRAGATLHPQTREIADPRMLAALFRNKVAPPRDVS